MYLDKQKYIQHILNDLSSPRCFSNFKMFWYDDNISLNIIYESHYNKCSFFFSFESYFHLFIKIRNLFFPLALYIECMFTYTVLFLAIFFQFY